MKYKVSITDDLSETKKFLKANGVKKFSVTLEENDHGVYGREVLGHYVTFKTSDKRLIAAAQRKFDLVSFMPDLDRRWKSYHRYNPSLRRPKFFTNTTAQQVDHYDDVPF